MALAHVLRGGKIDCLSHVTNVVLARAPDIGLTSDDHSLY
jgi:hypothetical protein